MVFDFTNIFQHLFGVHCTYKYLCRLDSEDSLCLLSAGEPIKAYRSVRIGYDRPAIAQVPHREFGLSHALLGDPARPRVKCSSRLQLH